MDGLFQQPVRWLRGLVREGITCPHDLLFALMTSLAWLAFYNDRFWTQTVVAMWEPTIHGALFMLSLFGVVLVLQTALLASMPTRRTMRALASALFLIGAASSYFSSEYGIVLNREMMRNVIETNVTEARDLLTGDFIAHWLLFGIVPAILVWRIRLRPSTWRLQLRDRAIFLLAAVVFIGGSVYAASADYAVFLRQYKPVRYSLNPVAPVVGMAQLLAAHKSPGGALTDPGHGAVRVSGQSAKPMLVVLVVGETARAANFQLGGYGRETNPELSRIPGLLYFTDVTACGTSTAISVPCLFSHLPREQFNVDRAGGYANLLDTLARAGFDVEWHDNNAGCKGVCARVKHETYDDRHHHPQCANAQCDDAVEVSDLIERLRSIEHDTVIVFHQIGSHGPAYSERYPRESEIFKPACRSSDLHRCTRAEIVNAYDNTIAYTDHVLAGQIAALREASSRIDSLLVYVSDHGESLGEGGLYLHGLPYHFAPDTQKHVPMLVWPSQGYVARFGFSPDCALQRTSRAVSHDHFYHTVLGVAGVRNQVYDARLDIFAACRDDLGKKPPRLTSSLEHRVPAATDDLRPVARLRGHTGKLRGAFQGQE